MKTKICIFGGAFNPPTEGHVKIAELLLDNGFDEVWITPCYKHLYGKELEDPSDRLNMCQIATRNNPKIHVFDYEIRHKLSGSTFDFATKLLNDPELDADITFFMGQDNANTFHKWHRAYELQKIAKFVVVTRGGYKELEEIQWYRDKPHSHVHSNLRECSSTDVREYIHKNGRDNQVPMLDEAVRKYIKKKKLYLSEEEIEKRAKEIEERHKKYDREYKKDVVKIVTRGLLDLFR